MILFKGYTNIKDFLHRFTILKMGKFHMRLHKLISDDETTLYHNHPFHFLSFIIKGGYTEVIYNPKTKETKTIKHNRFSLILRNRNTYHRLEKVNSPTITLFISFGKHQWDAINFGTPKFKNGIYKRKINNKEKWCKYSEGIWYVGNQCICKAVKENRPSIHQA
jgi:hypothetical protein